MTPEEEEKDEKLAIAYEQEKQAQESEFLY